MDLQTAKAEFLVEFLDLPAATLIEGASWEPFQIQFLNNSTRFGIDVKARQIAWSWTAAADAVADGIVNPGTPHVFVSINQDEAKEKIRYAKAIIQALDEPVRPRLRQNAQTEIELDNGSRLISHPCRPPRGKARARIYLDEMAHYPQGMDQEIYRAALPATVKGDGYIRLGSSPLGARGLFWEIATEATKKYPAYGLHRMFVPWWCVRALCQDVTLARMIAPEMVTEERVRAFGAPALVEIFENMFLEDFQQEYECAWVDEATAWISWEVIKRNQKADLTWFHARGVDEAESAIDELLAAINSGKVEPALVGGIDVGRTRNTTELAALGRSTTGQLPLRLLISLDRVEYDDQERLLGYAIRKLPFTQVLIDRNGIGSQLAENLERTGRAQGVDFTNSTKELWAVEARIQAERGNTPLPLERGLAYQIHSIKKNVTAAKNNVYDTARNEKHHADQFWAWALGIWAAVGGRTEVLTAGWLPELEDWRG